MERIRNDSNQKWKARSFFVTWIFLVLFCVWFLPNGDLIINLEQERRRKHKLQVLVALVSINIFLYLILQGSDPGRLSRDHSRSARQIEDQAGFIEEKDVEVNDEGEEGHEMSERVKMITRPRHELQFNIDGKFPLGYCKYCEFIPPLRAQHCRYCDRCVATFDHHCHFLATCIGEKNHCRFWWYLLSQNISILLAISIVNMSFNWRAHDLTDWCLDNLLPLSLVFLLWLLESFAFIMLLVHTFLAMGNMTSYEFAKGPERIWYLRGSRSLDLPFSQGCFRNLLSFCCYQDAVFAASRSSSSVVEWHRPKGPIVRDSDNVCAHPWENRYWTCC